MKRIRSFCIFVLLVVIMLTMVFIPPTVSKIKDGMLFGKVTIHQLDKSQIAKDTAIDAADKIALINSYNIGQENIVMVSQEQNITLQQDNKDVVGLVMNELKKMKTDGIFPPIIIDNVLYFKYSTRTYTNMDQQGISAEIWDIEFSFDKITINLLMDVDTNLIYQYFIWSKELLPAFASEEIPQKFAAYLDIERDAILPDSKWKEENSKIKTEKYIVKNREVMYQIYQSADGRAFGIVMRF